MVFILGVLGTALFLLALSNVFLNPEYLKSASGASNQLKLIIDALFDLSIYKNLNIAEIVTTIVFTLSCYPIFFGLNKAFTFFYSKKEQ